MMRAKEIWCQGAIAALAGIAVTMFVFHWQNPELTQFQALQEAARWPFMAWGAPIITFVVYVATAFFVKVRRAAR